MLKKRYALLAVIATLIVATAVSVVPSYAQTSQPDRCYGLNAADCQLAESNLSLASLRKLSSFNAAYEFEVKANDNAQVNFDFAVKGNASVAIKPESILQLVAGGPNAILDSLTL